MAGPRRASQSGARMIPELRPQLPTVALMALAAVVCLGTGCAERLLTCPRAVKVLEPPPPQQHPETVLFVTDRAQESPQTFNFSGEMNLSENRITYGAKCEDPVIGAVAICEKPVWLKEELPARLGKSNL